MSQICNVLATIQGTGSSTIMSSVFDGVIALAAVVAAVASAAAAWKALSIARQAFRWQKDQTAPRVVVRTYTTVDSPSLIYIRVENVGESPAYDIKLDCSRKLSKAFGSSADSVTPGRDLSTALFERGIPALAPGDSRTVLWGQFGGLFQLYGENFVRVVATYKNEQREDFETLSLLEVSSYEGNDASDNRAVTRIREELRTLNNLLGRVVRDGVVTVETLQEFQDRHERALERLREKHRERRN